MAEEHAFSAVIRAAGGGGAYVDVPFDVEEAFGRKRVPVVAHIDGEPYRGSLVRMGGPAHMLLIRKDVRERIGKQPGDTVSVTLREDTEERTVDVPEDLAAALAADDDAATFFNGLSYTHRREYVQWITEAKREQTRRDRVAKTLGMLQEGRRSR